MTSIEQDVERVRAVHAALTSEKQTVWVLKWANNCDEGIEVYATEAGARAELVKDFDEYRVRDAMPGTKEELDAIRIDLLSGEQSSFNDDYDLWFSISAETLYP